MISGSHSSRPAQVPPVMGIASLPTATDNSDADSSSAPREAANHSLSAAELPRVLTPEELAGILRLRKRSVYEAINRGDIPGVRRIGRKIRIVTACWHG